MPTWPAFPVYAGGIRSPEAAGALSNVTRRTAAGDMRPAGVGALSRDRQPTGGSHPLKTTTVARRHAACRPSGWARETRCSRDQPDREPESSIARVVAGLDLMRDGITWRSER